MPERLIMDEYSLKSAYKSNIPCNIVGM